MSSYHTKSSARSTWHVKTQESVTDATSLRLARLSNNPNFAKLFEQANQLCKTFNKSPFRMAKRSTFGVSDPNVTSLKQFLGLRRNDDE